MVWYLPCCSVLCEGPSSRLHELSVAGRSSPRRGLHRGVTRAERRRLPGALHAGYVEAVGFSRDACEVV